MRLLPPPALAILQESPGLRAFLVGTSMGGAIALNVSLRLGGRGAQCAGAVLLAPMVRIAPEAMPPR